MTKWQDKAPCKNRGELFFSEELGDIKRSKRICSVCPFADRCLQIAINAEELFGVWGGLSQRERRKYQRMFAGGISVESAKEIVISHGNKVLVESN